MTTKTKELMVIERLLLEMDARLKFELDFNEAYKLHEMLINVGKITSYAFLIQEEFHEKNNDITKLEEYHNMVMESDVDIDTSDIVCFISKINEKYKNDDFNEVFTNIKYWD